MPDPAPNVAVVGASTDTTKHSAQSVRAHAGCGFNVYPINPKASHVEGLPAYASVSVAPVDRFDRITMYVPPTVGIALLDEIAAKGCDELWLNPGSESDALVEQARQLGLNPIVACSLIDCANRRPAG
ncbi:MAG: CoA-binding protein [Planctomycetota bacterium]